ncbi:ATP synthase subunit d, mitochondrial-like [Ruditapes philippinarum]|uniref:ATP synthase subunit d, mitochondrial-like n=1 Tax=Ruditapes philippinarum TaxID=129788 RepID=UPI00295ABF0B|nr:ATP synthase subunit d, mitochondrial-like [Ruditapes philippinarum]
MAARRVTKSAVDWVALQSKVPSKQTDAYRVLKSHSDKYISRVAELPESLPKIDFGEYKRRIASPAFVDEFEKLYNAMEVPYPKDPANQKAKFDSEEKVALQEKDAFVAASQAKLKGLNEILSAIASIPPPEKMTMQMYNHYFPEAAINPNRANPGFAPHHLKSAQMDLMEQYYNTSRNSRNQETIEEWEEIWRLKVEKQKAEKAKQMAEKQGKEIKS